MTTRRIVTKAQRRERNAGAEIGRQRAQHRESAMRHLVRKFKGLCALCGTAVNFKVDSPEYATVDHVQPLSKGGPDKPSNWQLAHKACNQAKGDALPPPKEISHDQ